MAGSEWLTQSFDIAAKSSQAVIVMACRGTPRAFPARTGMLPQPRGRSNGIAALVNRFESAACRPVSGESAMPLGNGKDRLG